MCSASVLAGVGPMAAVAGAVAGHVAERLRGMGCGRIVLDNGGDLCIVSETDTVVGVVVGTGPEVIRLRIGPTAMTGVCSSSAVLGHSVSLGTAEVCTVVADDPALADACATRLCNTASRDDPGEAAESVCSVPGVRGCLAVVDGTLAVCGDVEIVRDEDWMDRRDGENHRPVILKINPNGNKFPITVIFDIETSASRCQPWTKRSTQ